MSEQPRDTPGKVQGVMVALFNFYLPTATSPWPQSAMFFRCQNRKCVLQKARNGKVVFYRICNPHLAKSYIWYHANYLLASTLVFLDDRKINLTEMMTFLVSLRDLQFCWYNILMTLLRENDHTGQLQFPLWKFMLNLNGEKNTTRNCRT